MPVFNNMLAGASGGAGGGYAIERSLRFNSGDSASLTKSFSSAGNRKTWTLSFWTKRCFDSGNYQSYLMGSTDVTEGFNLRLNDPTDQKFYLATASGSGLTSDAVFRDFSAWMHVVIVYDSTDSTSTDRVKLYVNGERQTFGSGSYPSLNLDSEFNNSGDFGIGYHNGNTALDAYLAEYHFIDGQALSASDFGETDSNSVWQPIKYAGTYGTNGFHLDFSDTSSSAALGTDSANSNDWTVNNLTAASGVGPGITSTVPENLTGNWRGIIGIVPSGTSGAVAVFPDGGGTAQSRGTFYWTGLTIGDTITWYGTTGGTDSRGVTGNVDETSVSAPGSSLGTIQLTVNAASGSAKIDFNGTANCYGITPGPVSSEYNDALRDSPVNGDSANDTGAGGEISGNYCTWNRLCVETDNALSNGNLVATHTASTGWDGNPGGTNFAQFIGTMGVTSGKWYWEGSFSSTVGCVGIVSTAMGTQYYVGYENKSAGYTSTIVYVAGLGSAVSSMPSIAANDVIGIAIDMDNGYLYFSKNGTFINSGNPVLGTGYVASGLTGETIYPAVSQVGSNDGYTFTANFGQRPFNTAAPSGYKALCTANLSDPTIADGSTAFDAVLYSGTSNAQSITGLGFSPDLVWTKNRGASASHALYDNVRGAGELLRSNENTAEVNVSSRFTSFDSNGFSIGGTSIENNGSSNSYVSWAWDAGSSNTTIAAGGLNSSLYDQSQTWSTALTSSTGFLSAYPVTTAFDGTFQGNGGAASGLDTGTTFTLTPPASITVTSLEFNCYTSCTLTLPDGSTQTIAGVTTNNTDVAANIGSGFTFTGSNSITLSNTSGHLFLQRIKINGKELVDSGVSVTTVPSIASTVRANPSAGVSIVSYTATASTGSIAHGLNTAPAFVLCKRRDSTGDWWAGHVGAGWTKGAYLQVTDAFASGAGWWNNTAPDSNVVSLGSYPTTGSTSATYIAYCFAPVEGYSAFGSYEASSSLPFVYTGFSPRWILIKNIDANNDWIIYDSERNSYNESSTAVAANLSTAESGFTSGYGIDILSNGFKIRTSSSGAINANTHLFAAFAEHPFKTSRAR